MLHKGLGGNLVSCNARSGVAFELATNKEIKEQKKLCKKCFPDFHWPNGLIDFQAAHSGS